MKKAAIVAAVMFAFTLFLFMWNAFAGRWAWAFFDLFLAFINAGTFAFAVYHIPPKK